MSSFFLILSFISLSALILYTALVICALFIGVPVIPSHKRIGQVAAKLVQKHEKILGSTITVAELGAGYGGQALLLSRLLPFARVTAFELNALAWPILKMRAAWNRHSNLIVKRTNFFLAPLQDFDVIFCYLSKPCIKELEKTMVKKWKKSKRKKPVLFLSYAVPLSGFKPVKTIPIRGYLFTDILYAYLIKSNMLQ